MHFGFCRSAFCFKRLYSACGQHCVRSVPSGIKVKTLKVTNAVLLRVVYVGKALRVSKQRSDR